MATLVAPGTPPRRSTRRLTSQSSAEKDPNPGQQLKVVKAEPGSEQLKAVKREAPTVKEACAAAQKGCTLSWFHANMDSIAEADSQIGASLANRKTFCEHTTPKMHQLCDDILNNVLKMGPSGSENNSVLLLGEAGSGKTHVVEWSIKELLQAEPDTIVLRAKGSAYATDVECLRHLATQMTSRLECVPHANASFKAGMDWIKGVFKGSFKRARTMVMVLDQFEYFCSRARQTLLYNLFDIAQEAGVHLSVIGTSEKMDVMDSLEKRIRSRFSMRHLELALPTTMDGLVQVLMAQLKLPANSQLKTQFISQFSKHVESALFAKRLEWKPYLETGRAPSWFLYRCLPVARLLHEACSAEPVAKRPRLAQLPSTTHREASMLLLDSLTETDHIVMIALYRLKSRNLARTLSTVLHEVQLLHDSPGLSLLYSYNTDLYAAAFDRLLQLRLLDLPKSGIGDTAKRHLTITNCMERIYGDLVQELGKAVPESTSWPNPLRGLPQSIQQWASRQRAMQ